MSKIRRVLLTLLALALLMPVMRTLLAAMLPDASVDPVPARIGGMVMSLLMLGLPAWQLRPWTSPRLNRTKKLWQGIGLGVVAALLCRMGMMPLDAAWQSMTGLTANVMPVPESIPLAMLYLLALAIVPALTEEGFFRGALLTGLLDGSRRTTAVLLTTVTFALMHGSLANLPSLLVLSLVLSLLMLYTGHIAVPMAAHLVYNLTALLGLTLTGGWCILCGVAVAVLCGWLITRQPKVAHVPMKMADALIAAAILAAMLISTLI